MWDSLLVLGQVPGTNFQITFYWLLVFSLAIVLLPIAIKRYRGAQKQVVSVQMVQLKNLVVIKPQTKNRAA